MNESFLVYHEPVFRPPSEANSVIIQVTHGCKWNKCHFCEMYTSKSYSVKPLSTIKKEISLLSGMHPDTNRIFIGDGDLFTVDFPVILETIQLIKVHFLKVKRISCYASTRELNKFDKLQLAQLKEAGLDLLYIGLESGDNEVLALVNKGTTTEEQAAASLKAKSVGFKLSVMILNGLGGRQHTYNHAINSAKLLNQIQPELLAMLVISFPYGFEHFKNRVKNNFEPLSQLEMLKEMRLLLQHLELKSTVFRSDHASNYLVFKGGLNRDKDTFINQLDHIIEHTIHVPKPHLNESRFL
ncbi:radical SAM protein [Carboxylicivirga sp. A043]|uniref:radical SAM protein n=1 Tax=Carboxylicivirga litoralis TaxID=2816963 RepID=UPI0021CAFA8E|nr:radical SAM protein [Carboxylicivirga sp. A043]MCU4154681.1 radical SAM protein [Carboxylicivirga sp. A043]